MISANFTRETHKTVYGLWQWHYGQILRIEGLSLPEGTEVHFASPYTEMALVVEASIVDEHTAEANIPNQILVGRGDGKPQSYDILAYVYIEDDTSGQTKYTIRLPVKGRLKPEDYVYTDTEVLSYSALEGRIRVLEGNQIGNQSEEVISKSNYLNDGERKTIGAAVSFMDDDCRKETYTTLFEEVIKKNNIPYALACPAGSIGDEKYMTYEQLKEMYDYGVSISCHHWRQYNMDDTTLLPSSDDYEDDLTKCDAQFAKWGISNVDSVSYPQGKYRDDYIQIAKKHYRMGFTVDKGINQIPYESYYMKRVEMFSNSSEVEITSVEIENIDEDGNVTTETVNIPTTAKTYVEQLATDGGWLILMTHAWYAYFDVNLLSGLIKYIKSMGINIADINTVIEKTGNIIEVGKFKKPLAERTTPFFVVDSTGATWSNLLNLIEKATVEYETLNVTYYTGTYINPSGSFRAGHSDINRTVSLPIEVKEGEVYLLTCSAIYQQALYVIGTPIEGSNSITPFDGAYKIPLTNTNEGIEGDTILIDYEVVVPADGIMYVSSNRNIQPNGFVIKRVEISENEAESKLEGYVKTSDLEQVMESLGNKITTPTTATVGQVLVVKSVDENGVPTEWEYAEAGGDVDVDAELKEYYTTQKTQLAENIRYKGVETSTEDSLGVLVGKVLDIPSAVEPTETIPEQTTLIANALQETLGIELVWSDVEASGYLILRKENFAPTSTADGTVVYDGPELTYTDTDVERDKQYYYRIFPYNDLHQYQATEDRAIVFVDYVDRSGQKTIGDLVLGDIVKFGQFGTSLFTWKIVDTLDKQSGYVTVAAEQALGSYQFDAPENDTDNPNTVTNRKNQGNNRWSFSNIRQFLNSDAEAGEWYVAQHDYDVAPSYKTQAPFLNAFTDFEKEIIVKKTNKCVLDSADGGGSETVIDKIWLASSYAMGLEVFQPLEDDHVYESFVDNTSRAFQSNYWLRTINGTTSASGVRVVNSTGTLSIFTANGSHIAVRPFCCLPTSAYVYWSDSDSAYAFADDSQRNLATEE